MKTVYACAAPPRTAVESAAMDEIDQQVVEIAAALGAQQMRYPSLISRAVLEAAEYPKAFPHLLLSASRLDELHTGWCLSPAVCYHTYAQLSGHIVGGPIVITARGRCFRAESESQPGVRQIEFDMREIVLIGDQDWIDATVEVLQQAVESRARELGLPGEWETAEDPFFLPTSAGKALMQRLRKVKVEYQCPRAGGLALASINRHGTFFGERFDITTASGAPIHTACVAVGLDRWAHLGRSVADTRVAFAGAHQEAES